MKKIYRISLMLFALALCGLAACSRDSVDEVIALGDGNKANVELTFNVNSSLEVETRAAQSTYYEHLVQNIYIFVFNGDKRVNLSQNFFTSTDIEGYPDYITSDDFQSSGKIQFDAISGSGLRICAIANIGTSNSVMGDQITRATTNDTSSTDDDTVEDTTTADLTKMDAITSYTELKKLSAKLKSNTIFRGASFLMTGEVTDNLVANQTTNVTIHLSRTDSKITFNVKAEPNDDSNISDMEFIPGKWRVVNVPAVSYVLPHIEVANAGETLTEDKDATINENDFFSVSEAEAPQFEGTVGGEANSGTFTFYMYENLKKPAKGITEKPTFDQTVYEGNLMYALREKQSKTDITTTNVTGVPDQTYVNGDFVYAPEFGTYVVFTGELSYTQKDSSGNDQYVIADVEYCVHLGHNSPDNVDCYNTLRNHHYTYNVTITGVNSLVVEVDNDPDQEERPGAEGDVVISATEIHNVDGHYDRALIKLTAEEASNLLFSVSTPFERGLDDMDDVAELKDYKWIKFLVNSDVEVGDTSYAAYPGDDCYDGGASACGTSVNSTVYGKSVVLRDIRQLSNYFRDNPPTGDVYITAFIDEYLYFYDPTSDNVVTKGNVTNTTYKGVQDVTADDTANLLMWKQSVNTSYRMLHIVKAGDMKYSEDGETSVSRSVVTFKQRPILTFYNVAAEDLTSAWGTETINETPKMTVTRTSYPSTTNYNYYQQAQNLTAYSGTNTQNSWADVISSTEQYGLGSKYQDPSYACAMRNRDFNGNGNIDQEEVQWYLASIDQMSDLWIGEPAMPKYVYLYDEENPDGTYTKNDRVYSGTHIVTSTIRNNSPMVYWAEEYGSTSTYENSTEWKQAPLDSNGKPIVALRCVRNLGLSFKSKDIPQDYVVVDKINENFTTTNDTSNEYLVRLDYLNPVALRSVDDAGLPLPFSDLNTMTENNRPYVAYYVDPDYYSAPNTKNSGTTSWYEVYKAEISVSTEDNICPAGYRMPNQREMLIMSTRVDGWDYSLIAGDGAQIGRYAILNGQTIKATYGGKEMYTYGIFYNYVDGPRVSRSIGKTWVDSIDNIDYSNAGSDDYYYNTGCVVRCVKDNQGYTPPSPASAYNKGGSVTQ